MIWYELHSNQEQHKYPKMINRDTYLTDESGFQHNLLKL